MTTLGKLYSTHAPRMRLTENGRHIAARWRGEPWPVDLVIAHKESVRAVHSYYRLRDGDNGLLGRAP